MPRKTLLNDFLFAKGLVQNAGDIICPAPMSKRVKMDNLGATSIDAEAEDYIIAELKGRFPDYEILSEERHKAQPKSYDFSKPTWVLDPIDGTENYFRGSDTVAISLALKEEKKTVIGIVYNPFTGELYATYENMDGAYGNGKLLEAVPSKVDKLKDATVNAISIEAFEKKNALPLLSELITTTKDLKTLGCTSLECTYAGTGKTDATVKLVTSNIWGYSAGVYIAEKIGARVTDGEGNIVTPDSDIVVVSNGLIHDDLIDIIKRSYRKNER